jgi:hypothetical protein
MAKYKITIVETAIYDVYVDAESLEQAKDKAIYDVGRHSKNNWFKNAEASSYEFGDDHCLWENNKWREVTK